MRLDLWSWRRPAATAADAAARPDVRRRAVEVRWQGDAGPPRPFARPPGTPDDAASPKAGQMCPAGLDLGARLVRRPGGRLLQRRTMRRRLVVVMQLVH